MLSVIVVDWGGRSSRQDGWSGAMTTELGPSVAKERVHGDAGGAHRGTVRETETIVLMGREAKRKVGSCGRHLVGRRAGLVCQ